MSDQIEDEEHKKQQLVKARTIFEVISFLSTPSSSPSHAQRNVDGPPPPYRYSASKSDHHHGPGSSVPNDFSMTYNITTTEGCVILFVLALWILSLRKLIKNFDKLRTNPIQVPYKYRLKDPENINHINICKNQNETVIMMRDPVLKLSQDQNRMMAARSRSTDDVLHLLTASCLNPSSSYTKSSQHDEDEVLVDRGVVDGPPTETRLLDKREMIKESPKQIKKRLQLYKQLQRRRNTSGIVTFMDNTGGAGGSMNSGSGVAPLHLHHHNPTLNNFVVFKYDRQQMKETGRILLKGNSVAINPTSSSSFIPATALISSPPAARIHATNNRSSLRRQNRAPPTFQSSLSSNNPNNNILIMNSQTSMDGSITASVKPYRVSYEDEENKQSMLIENVDDEEEEDNRSLNSSSHTADRNISMFQMDDSTSQTSYLTNRESLTDKKPQQSRQSVKTNLKPLASMSNLKMNMRRKSGIDIVVTRSPTLSIKKPSSMTNLSTHTFTRPSKYVMLDASDNRNLIRYIDDDDLDEEKHKSTIKIDDSSPLEPAAASLIVPSKEKMLKRFHFETSFRSSSMKQPAGRGSGQGIGINRPKRNNISNDSSSSNMMATMMLDPKKISPLVRHSLLDLHQKSADRVAYKQLKSLLYYNTSSDTAPSSSLITTSSSKRKKRHQGTASPTPSQQQAYNEQSTSIMSSPVRTDNTTSKRVTTRTTSGESSRSSRMKSEKEEIVTTTTTTTTVTVTNPPNLILSTTRKQPITQSTTSSCASDSAYVAESSPV